MKEYSFRQAPFKVYGVPFFEQTGQLRRLPEELIEKLEPVKRWRLLGNRCPGARVRFRTDSKTITVRFSLRTLGTDAGMSIFSCQSVQVLCGSLPEAEYLGLVNPANYQTLSAERTFTKRGEMEDITLFLPRNEPLEDLTVLLEDDASVEPPTPYDYEHPVLFYGSSITEGGCASNLFGAYNAILSNRLNVDYYNFGFSASARGELELADYINTIPMSVFVYDYDHNAPDAAFLRKTHEPFFLRIREKHPDLPVVMMSMPKARYDAQNRERREVIKQTYKNAVARGDRHVWFIDGEQFFGETDRDLCSLDTIHPNDLGFYRMAKIIEPVLREALQAR